MLRLPRALLDSEIAGQYCVEGHVSMLTTRDHVAWLSGYGAWERDDGALERV
jgi:hypothetical protein